MPDGRAWLDGSHTSVGWPGFVGFRGSGAMSEVGGLLARMDALPLGLVGDGALRAAVAADREVTRMEGVRLDHLAQYLGEMSAQWRAPKPGPGVEQAVRLGGPGTPVVPEFAVCEIATALGLTQPAATGLCADVLDLAYRLRHIAGAVRCGQLAFARARVIARRTRDLPVEQVALVEERLCTLRHTGSGPVPMAAVVPMSRLRSVTDQAVLTVRGPESQAEAEQRVAESLWVRVSPAEPGAADVTGRLASADAVRLDQRLDQVAGWLRQVGDDRPTPILRAVALGLLADPDLLQALSDLREEKQGGEGSSDKSADALSRTMCPEAAAPALPAGPAALAGLGGAGDQAVWNALEAPPPWEEPPRDGEDEPRVPDPIRPPGEPEVVPAGIAGCPPGVLEKFANIAATVLYLHLDRASGTWVEERGGALTSQQAKALVGHSKVSVRPVLDLAEPLSYTGYVAPPLLREQLAMLNAGYCPFPYCHRRARAGDVDHQIPDSRGGPTATRNTHRPCRKHHRAKDKGGWRVVCPVIGVWVWTSPAGAVYLVTNGTTTQLNGITRYATLADEVRQAEGYPDVAATHDAEQGHATRTRAEQGHATQTRAERGDAAQAGADRGDVTQTGTEQGDAAQAEAGAARRTTTRNARRGRGPRSDVPTSAKDAWTPPWDPWHDPDPLTQDEHDVTYGLLNIG